MRVACMAAQRRWLSLSTPPGSSATASALAYASGTCEKPLVALTVGSLLDATAARHPTRTALVSYANEHETLTYADLALKSDLLAATLLGPMGIKPGEAIAVWSPSNSAWATLHFAAAKAGIISVFVNPAYKADELQYALNRVPHLRALFMPESFKGTRYPSVLQQVVPELDACRPGHLRSAALPDLRHAVVFSETRFPGCHRFVDLAAAGVAGDSDVSAMRAAAANIDIDDVTNVQFSSGTTGRPKAILLSHHSLVNNGWISADAQGFTPRDVLVNCPPFFHCFGSVLGTLAVVHAGAAQIIPSWGFDAGAALRAAARHSATAVYGVPTMFTSMLNHATLPELMPRLASWRTGIIAGGTCPPAVMRRLADEIGVSEMTIQYGMTETAPISAFTPRHAPMELRSTTVGTVAPHTEIKIIDPFTRSILPRGASGELCTRGYCVMKGYLGQPEKTAEVLDRNGWMATGDLAVMDESGYIRIVGRLKDMVNRGGEKIFPAEVEAVLLQHPAVAEAALFGVADALFGEELGAWIQLRSTHEGRVTEAELRDFLREKVAHFKVPRYVRLVDSFHQTASGKMQKFKMREETEAELAEHEATAAAVAQGQPSSTAEPHHTVNHHHQHHHPQHGHRRRTRDFKGVK